MPEPESTLVCTSDLHSHQTELHNKGSLPTNPTPPLESPYNDGTGSRSAKSPSSFGTDDTSLLSMTTLSHSSPPTTPVTDVLTYNNNCISSFQLTVPFPHSSPSNSRRTKTNFHSGSQYSTVAPNFLEKPTITKPTTTTASTTATTTRTKTKSKENPSSEKISVKNINVVVEDEVLDHDYLSPIFGENGLEFQPAVGQIKEQFYPIDVNSNTTSNDFINHEGMMITSTTASNRTEGTLLNSLSTSYPNIHAIQSNDTSKNDYPTNSDLHSNLDSDRNNNMLTRYPVSHDYPHLDYHRANNSTPSSSALHSDSKIHPFQIQTSPLKEFTTPITTGSPLYTSTINNEVSSTSHYQSTTLCNGAEIPTKKTMSSPTEHELCRSGEATTPSHKRVKFNNNNAISPSSLETKIPTVSLVCIYIYVCVCVCVCVCVFVFLKLKNY